MKLTTHLGLLPKIKNGWSYIFNPRYAFMLCRVTALPFLYKINIASFWYEAENMHYAAAFFLKAEVNILLHLTMHLASSSSISTTARCGLWPVEQHPAIFSICRQLSPSPHS
jgi:hypothetical protein